MKFSTREDIEAPIEHVFARITEFTTFERSAMRRGLDIARTEGAAGNIVGTEWRINFQYRGKPRGAEIRICDCEKPNKIAATFTSGGVEGESVVELVPLSPSRTRVAVGVEMKPTTLTARLFIQSLRLAKTNLQRKFKTRIADYAESIEENYRRP